MPESMDRISKALQKMSRADDARPDAAVAPPVGVTPEPTVRTRRVPVSLELLRKNRIIAGMPSCAFVDAYKILRTKVLQRMRDQGWNTLAVTGCGPGAGKSLTAVNLAVALALEVDQTVLLVDANLRHPSIHRYFGIEPEFGLSDYLLDHTPIHDVLLSPEGIDDGFVILSGKRPLVNASEMLSSPRMQELVDELKRRYAARIVLFDLPHLGTADALAFIPNVDALLLVIEEGGTGREELQHTIQQIHTTPILGTVLNKADVDFAGDQ